MCMCNTASKTSCPKILIQAKKSGTYAAKEASKVEIKEVRELTEDLVESKTANKSLQLKIEKIHKCLQPKKYKKNGKDLKEEVQV